MRTAGLASEPTPVPSTRPSAAISKPGRSLSLRLCPDRCITIPPPRWRYPTRGWRKCDYARSWPGPQLTRPAGWPYQPLAANLVTGVVMSLFAVFSSPASVSLRTPQLFSSFSLPNPSCPLRSALFAPPSRVAFGLYGRSNPPAHTSPPAYHQPTRPANPHPTRPHPALHPTRPATPPHKAPPGPSSHPPPTPPRPGSTRGGVGPHPAILRTTHPARLPPGPRPTLPACRPRLARQR